MLFFSIVRDGQLDIHDNNSFIVFWNTYLANLPSPVGTLQKSTALFVRRDTLTRVAGNLFAVHSSSSIQCDNH
jgi:hypothetical protein